MSDQTASTRCLVVDDSRVVRRVARKALEKAGLDVVEATNGLEALTACRASMPDCVLLDWNMPVMNGIEFLTALRSEFGPGRPPVILCTTEGELHSIMQALEAGAQEYVMKPFDDEILIGKLSQLGLA